MSMHRMSAADTAWLHMDRATNRLIVNSVMWFDEGVDWGEVRDLVSTRLVATYPRFRQRVLDRVTSVWWYDDDEFDLERHLRHASLPAPGGIDELQQYVSRCLSQRLPRDRPLWQLHFIDGYHGHGAALVSQIHHCIADGVALSRVMLSLTDDPTQASTARVVAPLPAAERPPSWRVLTAPVGRAAGALVAPHRFPAFGRDLLAAGRAVARLVTMPGDADTALSAPLSGTKSVVWSAPTPLCDLSAAAHAAGVTVNDLLLAAVSGALRRHLGRRDGRAPDVRAVVPINLRGWDAPLPADLGNAFGLLYVQLPTSVDDPAARLAVMHERADALKRSAEPVVSSRILELTGHAPYEASQIMVDVFSSKASVVITNVPGPSEPVVLAGRRVSGTIGWPPESGGIGLGISFISYAGDMLIGIMADDNVVPQPGGMLTDIVDELHELLRGQPCESSAW